LWNDSQSVVHPQKFASCELQYPRPVTSIKRFYLEKTYKNQLDNWLNNLKHLPTIILSMLNSHIIKIYQMYDGIKAYVLMNGPWKWIQVTLIHIGF